ncbi:MAG TPA: threonine/serine dehydratase [Gammaproteobacteria bacterium]
MTTSVLPTAQDVDEASERLADWVVETPVLESPALDERIGGRVLLKAENLQHGGSFKIRGALNRMLQLAAEERDAGVVAYSSGNHAQAVALAARWLGIKATIVMPADAPRVKQETTRAWGAEVVLYDREREDRASIAADIAERRGAAIVPPFDHPHVIAGQGTVGLELAAAAIERRAPLDALYVPCSGGGLVAGCALAVQASFEDCAVYAVEPAGCDDTARSLARGERCVARTPGETICDALRAPSPGAITFAINRERLEGVVTVDDEEVLAAMAFAARHLKLVLEPSGAAALAAVLREPQAERAAVGVVLSGGNVDGKLLGRALADGGQA